MRNLLILKIGIGLLLLLTFSCQQRYGFRTKYSVKPKPKDKQERELTSKDNLPEKQNEELSAKESEPSIPKPKEIPSIKSEKDKSTILKLFALPNLEYGKQLPFKLKSTAPLRIKGKNNLVFLSAFLLIVSVVSIIGDAEMAIVVLLLIFAIVSLVSFIKDLQKWHRVRFIPGFFFLLGATIFGFFFYFLFAELQLFLLVGLQCAFMAYLMSLVLMRILDAKYLMSKPFLYWSLRIMLVAFVILYFKFPDFFEDVFG
ncbi:MAG: hypothetical protein CFE21_15520 [Bacteroidetes bacterium B1(2017)]|nr:MAG: hypothetical protein CFE21_15520 [Bacteroidetes bacterium B1(2017)]